MGRSGLDGESLLWETAILSLILLWLTSGRWDYIVLWKTLMSSHSRHWLTLRAP